jgi:hypothetical protein
MHKLAVFVKQCKFVGEEKLVGNKWLLKNPDIISPSLQPGLGILFVPHAQLWNLSEDANLNSFFSLIIKMKLNMVGSVKSIIAAVELLVSGLFHDHLVRSKLLHQILVVLKTLNASILAAARSNSRCFLCRGTRLVLLLFKQMHIFYNNKIVSARQGL